MSNIKNGGAAFPGGVNQVYTDRAPGDPTQDGMSLRDYFAAKALHGMVEAEYAEIFDCVRWAREAYMMANAMLTERDKWNKT